MRTLIVVPTYNEKDNLGRLAQAIQRQNVDIDILFVDDNSPDGTGRLAEALSRDNPRINVLHRAAKEGIGRAYQEGFRWALDKRYDVIMQMDADLSHDPQAIPEFLDKIQSHDAVFGSRYFKGVRVYNWSFKRLLLSKLSNDFIKVVLRLQTTDTTTAFKCFRREVLEAIDVESFRGKQNAFLIELVYKVIKSGYRTTEIPFLFRERETGESKMSFRVALESLFIVTKLALLRKRHFKKKES
jgi:dolichol-phosphate mannosyltransferase